MYIAVRWEIIELRVSACINDRAGLEARLAQQTAEANALTEEINCLESELEAAHAKANEIGEMLAASQAEEANHQIELRATDARAHKAEPERQQPRQPPPASMPR